MTPPMGLGLATIDGVIGALPPIGLGVAIGWGYRGFAPYRVRRSHRVGL